MRLSLRSRNRLSEKKVGGRPRTRFLSSTLNRFAVLTSLAGNEKSGLKFRLSCSGSLPGLSNGSGVAMLAEAPCVSFQFSLSAMDVNVQR